MNALHGKRLFFTLNLLVCKVTSVFKKLKFIRHSAVRNLVANAYLQLSSFFMAQQPPVGQGLFIHEVSRSHNNTLQSVGLLWTSDQLVAETSS